MVATVATAFGPATIQRVGKEAWRASLYFTSGRVACRSSSSSCSTSWRGTLAARSDIHRQNAQGIEQTATSRSVLSPFLTGRGRAQQSHRGERVAKWPTQARSRACFSTSAPRAKQVDFLLADVGEGITECEIVEWYVQPGSHVEEFDMLVLLQTDKATVEVTSRFKGKVTEHCYKVGEVARVGTPLCRIEVEGGAEEAAESQDAQMKAAPAEESNDNEQQPSPAAPALTSKSDVPASAAETDNARQQHQILATPAVRRISRENGIELHEVTGTGKDGRVTKEDVQQLINDRESGASRGSSTLQPSSLSKSSTAASASTTTVPLSGTRKAMFKAMTSTWQTPHFLYTDEIDVTQLNELRSLLQSKRARLAREGEPKLTLLPFLIKAMSLVLDDHPLFRSTLNVERMELQQKDAHRFSIALASSRGLVTPALPGDLRQQSILDIAQSVAYLQQRGASERGLSPADMGSAGSTITLSNIGSVGGTYTFPLLPPTGQLVIGGLGRARTLPRFDETGESIVKATILTASFAADHRVVEGVELARFVDAWKQRVEDPASWVLEMR